MKVPASPEFEQQRRAHGLRFTCEECAHFGRTRRQCSFGYPTEEHRDAFYEPGYRVIVFCKSYELV